MIIEKNKKLRSIPLFHLLLRVKRLKRGGIKRKNFYAREMRQPQTFIACVRSQDERWHRRRGDVVVVVVVIPVDAMTIS